MNYLVKWIDVQNGDSVIAGIDFETPEQAASYIRKEILRDYYNGLSGAYVYTIIKEEIKSNEH